MYLMKRRLLQIDFMIKMLQLLTEWMVAEMNKRAIVKTGNSILIYFNDFNEHWMTR